MRTSSGSSSHGQITPKGTWYDQPHDEWVVVLEGSARLAYENGEEVVLEKGDQLFLPRRRKHRVTWTSSPCLWLAIHVPIAVLSVAFFTVAFSVISSKT